MAINIPGLLAIIFFYLVILVVGIWAGRKTSEKTKDSKDVTMGEQSNIMLAGRNIGLFVGVFTMTGKPDHPHSLFKALFYHSASIH
ncbi:hypothetical protein HPB48_009630 [Haemaphysalis longicornis]|uniref:Uncharacterized protein n=1 Tax=Haemaphysalis longicornis TaxID=44386 RepID=A0A9J6G1U0_HAELO|nr:hypothetical protein HPB48_009630 [Haemaphysalis longicornis]